MPLEVCRKTGSDFRKQGPVCLFCIPLRAAGARHQKEQEPRHGADLTLAATRETETGSKQCLAVCRSHAAMRERCSFQRGNAVMEKWALWGTRALTQKPTADGRQHLHTTLTPLGWGQLDEMPHYTHAHSRGQRFPGQSMTPALPSQLPRWLCGVWLSQNSSCKSPQKWPREPPQHTLPMPSLAGCPAFNSNQCKPSCAVSPSRSLSGRRVISQR